MGSITDVPGIRIGHDQNMDALTGCTVVLCEEGMVGGVDVRGSAPGTRETDALSPLNAVEEVHAVVLAGGSAFGLQAAAGVMAYLEARGVGFDTGYARVPIVPAAILYDLGIGDSTVRPDQEMGYRACRNASEETLVGNVGAGCGATVGKAFGMERAMKGGLGTASVTLADGLIVGAIMAVNAFGHIVDPSNGQIIAGPRRTDGSIADTVEWMRQRGRESESTFAGMNTAVGVVATNAKLSKARATKVAQMAQDGLARTTVPSHTMLDGDTIFTLASGDVHASVDLVGALAANVVAEAIVNGVKAAKGISGLPSAGDVRER